LHCFFFPFLVVIGFIISERSSALEAEKKLLKTAFYPVQRR